MIRVFVDTNVLVSAGLSSETAMAALLYSILNDPYRAILSRHVVDEFLDKSTSRKFCGKEEIMKAFLADILPLVQIVETPEEPVPEENYIADPKDRPILRAAIAAKADLLVSGDKHFLNARSRIDAVEIISPQEFAQRVLDR